MYVPDGKGSRVFATRALVVVQIAVGLTSYDDWPVSVNHFRHLIDVTPVWKMSSAITVFRCLLTTGSFTSATGCCSSSCVPGWFTACPMTPTVNSSSSEWQEGARQGPKPVKPHRMMRESWASWAWRDDKCRQWFVLRLFCSVQFKMVSMHSKKPTCAPPRLSGVSPTLPLKRIPCSSDWWWPSLVLSRKIV